jgi:C1A family cysteine protease
MNSNNPLTHSIPNTPSSIVSHGWMKESVDARDFTIENPELKSMLKLLFAHRAISLPKTVDLTPWCTPVVDQLQLGSCTACAAVGAVEYLEKRALGHYLQGSRLFVYKNTRNLKKTTGDTGAFNREAMKAIALFGIAPEKYWEYTDQPAPVPPIDHGFDDTPPPFLYSYAIHYGGVKYFRFDPEDNKTTTEEILKNLKSFIAAGLPVMFGIPLHESVNSSNIKGGIPFPGEQEQPIGGHAMLMVGYDDNIEITNLISKNTTKGAFLIKNSWGQQWGNYGFGWLPYMWVTSGLARDFWSILSMNWLETGKFGL